MPKCHNSRTKPFMFERLRRKSDSKLRLMENLYHLIDMQDCLNVLRTGDVSKVFAMMDSSIDSLVKNIATDMETVDPPTRDSAIEYLKRTYEDRQEYGCTLEPLNSTEGTALTKEQASRAEVDKLLLYVWNNKPGNPRYRRMPKPHDTDRDRR